MSLVESLPGASIGRSIFSRRSKDEAPSYDAGASVRDRADEELRLLAEQLDAPEAKEAMQAFIERRRPDFSRFA